MKPVKLDKEAVKQAILKAESETAALEAVYRMVYPNFDQIDKVDGHPACNDYTWKAICMHFVDLTNRLNKARDIVRNQVLPGGPWMNFGFAGGSDLGDWYVMPAPVTLRQEQEQH